MADVQCLPCGLMLPRAARKARAVSASLQGKSAGQEAPLLLAALPAHPELDSG